MPNASPYFLLNRSWTCSLSVLARSILDSLDSKHSEDGREKTRVCCSDLASTAVYFEIKVNAQSWFMFKQRTASFLNFKVVTEGETWNQSVPENPGLLDTAAVSSVTGVVSLASSSLEKHFKVKHLFLSFLKIYWTQQTQRAAPNSSSRALSQRKGSDSCRKSLQRPASSFGRAITKIAHAPDLTS